MMHDITRLTTTSGNDQFYPTPDNIAGKMLAKVDWDMVDTVLEPSAGKGDLVKCAVKEWYARNPRWRDKKLDVDCIEVDPYLQQILKYNFSPEARKDISNRYYELDRKSYSDRTSTENLELKCLREKIDIATSATVRIIHDDFLTYRGNKRYSLILMNPPFANGDLHLLKALEIQKNGGQVICLLNAETIRNPYTNTRKLLMQKLNEYEAKIQYVENAFTDAERRANVDVAIIQVTIPHTVPKSTIYERLEKAEEQNNFIHQATELTVNNYLEQMIQHYNVESAAGLELIHEYSAMVPYMQTRLKTESNPNPYGRAILTLSIGTDSNILQSIDVNEYLKAVRLKYWTGLFENPKFTERLTSNLREEYLGTVQKMSDYEFSMHNIQQVLAEMNVQLLGGVQETIMALFDKLTTEHTWYPESKGNVHYFNGWKTNKAHKIGKKCIIPTSGMFSSYAWKNETFEVSNAYKVISDIEKVFNYLDGGLTQEIDLEDRLNAANDAGITRNIECKYFKIDIFKKGTTHIKFTNMDIVDRFNIYAAKKRNWLPPSYGKAEYSNMTAEEQSVIDDFQGEEAYNKVLMRKDYYLSDPAQTNSLLMLGE